MTLLEAIAVRYSVRRYTPQPLSASDIERLTAEINTINADTGLLHLQLVTDEPRAFSGSLLTYGKFSGVRNYIVVAGRRAPDLDLKAGYYGERMVLLAQTMGLNTCWVGLTYRKIKGAFTLRPGEKVVALIALGHGETQGQSHRIKTATQVSNISQSTPDWFNRGVETALLAPTAINQQKFHFEYIAPDNPGAIPQVKATKSFSFAGYTDVDLGIARLHFEIGAAPARFQWE